MKRATEREYARLGRLLAERRAAAIFAGADPPTWTEHAAALDISVRSLQRADRWCSKYGAAREAAPSVADNRFATLAALDRRADVLIARLETLATAEYPGAAHELVAVCKALAAIDAATADLVRGLPGPDEPSAEVAARKARVQRDDSRFIARVRAADPAELNDALRAAVRRLRTDAIETDARTDTEACDLADELEEAPSLASWPALLVILREVAPDGAEALVAAAEAAERAWDRAPELDVDAILAKAKADAEAAANGANGAAH